MIKISIKIATNICWMSEYFLRLLWMSGSAWNFLRPYPDQCWGLVLSVRRQHKWVMLYGAHANQHWQNQMELYTKRKEGKEESRQFSCMINTHNATTTKQTIQKEGRNEVGREGGREAIFLYDKHTQNHNYQADYQWVLCWASLSNSSCPGGEGGDITLAYIPSMPYIPSPCCLQS